MVITCPVHNPEGAIDVRVEADSTAKAISVMPGNMKASTVLWLESTATSCKRH